MSTMISVSDPFGGDAEKQTAHEEQQPVDSRGGFAGQFFGSGPATTNGKPYEASPQRSPKWYRWLAGVGFEQNGIMPVPPEKRTDNRHWNLFTIFFTSLLSLLPLPTGMLATLQYGLSLRDASLVIFFFSLLTTIPPAFVGIGGTQTGMRQQIQARYCFGLYLAIVPLLLNAATIVGFTLISAVVGGQTISALNPEHVNVKVGIVIISIVSFLASLLGYRALHWLEMWSWIPNLVSLLVAVGCGGKYLHLQAETEPASVQQVLSYASIVAGYCITFVGTSSDYSTYHNPNESKYKIFAYMYMGILLPTVPLLILGAAIGGAVPSIESWSAANDVSGIGGVLYEMLRPAGGFGKFILVLLALSGIGNIAISSYSAALNMQMLLPIFTRIPRFVFILITMAIVIPMAIKAAEKWEESIQNFLALIGYWAGCFAAVLIEELIVFRRMDYSSYDPSAWNVGSKLPSGIPALGASVLSFGLVVPGMDQVWYVGPIAKTTGDIGFEMALALTALFYFPLRWVEIKWQGRL